MPWRRPSLAGAGAGFSTADPWLPVVADAESLCVESQQQDPRSTLSFLRELIHLRSREPALNSGTQRPVVAASDVFCFERELGRRFLIALNFFLLIVGMLMDIFSAIVVIVPLIAGIALHFDINPYHLGIVFLLNLEIGYITPPLGLNLFLSSRRFDEPLPGLYRASFVFWLIHLAVLLVISYLPSISLALLRLRTG